MELQGWEHDTLPLLLILVSIVRILLPIMINNYKTNWTLFIKKKYFARTNNASPLILLLKSTRLLLLVCACELQLCHALLLHPLLLLLITGNLESNLFRLYLKTYSCFTTFWWQKKERKVFLTYTISLIILSRTFSHHACLPSFLPSLHCHIDWIDRLKSCCSSDRVGLLLPYFMTETNHTVSSLTMCQK